MATSEAIPFAKTGGLADVCGALPVELSRLGDNVTLILPAYRHVYRSGQPIESTGVKFDIPIGSKIITGRFLRSTLPGTQIPVYLVEQADYFDRPELYRERGEDYRDNCERFVFFCRAVMESIQLLDLNIDVLHCNDWQTGLIPAYLHIEYRHTRGYDEAISLFTIHNMAYQGQFWHWDMLLTGLDWKYFNMHQMEFYGQLNLLKTGLVFSDAITTVSPTYAREIQASGLGCGLEGVLQQRREVLSGIVNGVDYSVWNPEHDSHLARTYNETNWQEGKAACKAALQNEFGLPPNPDSPVIGLIGRLADQKGWDLVAQILPAWARQEDVQWIILGTGEPQYHELLSRTARDFPGKVGLRLEFSDRLAHQIEAGSDLFLMPSRYEPCGLNQLYSLKYGTVPIVRTTGGLADTIVDASPEHLADRTATGFRFDPYDPLALDAVVRRACDVYRHQPDLWRQIVTTAMTQDWSWTQSARQYRELYSSTRQRKLSRLIRTP